jgi:hypothetical protein
MKALVVAGVAVALIGVTAVVAFAASEKKKHTHLDSPVAFPPAALADAPELGLGHVSRQVDTKGVPWIVALFPDTGDPHTTITVAALESPAGPWLRFLQHTDTQARELQKLDTAGQPIDPAAMKAAWGLA